MLHNYVKFKDVHYWVLFCNDGNKLECKSERIGVSAWFLYHSNGYLAKYGRDYFSKVTSQCLVSNPHK